MEKDPLLENQNVDYDSIRLRLQGYIDAMEEAYQEQTTKVVNMYILKRAMSPYLP